MKTYKALAIVLAFATCGASRAYALATGEVTSFALTANGGVQTSTGIDWNGQQFYLQADGGFSTQVPGTVSSTALLGPPVQQGISTVNLGSDSDKSLRHDYRLSCPTLQDSPTTASC